MVDEAFDDDLDGMEGRGMDHVEMDESFSHGFSEAEDDDMEVENPNEF